MLRPVTVTLVAFAWSSLAFCGEIHDAAQNGNLARVKELLKDNPDLVFSADENGMTALHFAAFYGHKDVAEWLLSNKAGVNSRNTHGGTPLLDAALMGHEDVAQLLLINQADVNTKDNDGGTPLHVAAQGGYKDIVELLLAHHADVDAIANINGINGVTPLHLAAQRGHKKVAEFLLAHGADCNAKESNGVTPLHYAAQEGYKDVAALLLVNKADVNVKMNNGGTPLHFAADKGHKDLVELLIANKGEVNARDNNGLTPLHSAAQKGYNDVTELLLASKAEVSPKDNNGATPLHYAAEEGHKDVVALLLANKAEVNAKDKNAWTPLHKAAFTGFKEIAELLLANKAEVNSITTLGYTPLHLAAAKGHNEVAELLLENKADVHVRAKNGFTPFQIASAQEHTDVAELLRQHSGQDTTTSTTDTTIHDAAQAGDLGKVRILLKGNPKLVFSKDDKDYTPLHYAAANGQKDVVELLLANGADMNAKGNDGQTPLHVAALLGHKDAAEVLLLNKAEVNAKDNGGKTPLLDALVLGHKDLIKLLLANKADVNVKSIDGTTPLHAAAANDFTEVVELLLANKAIVDCKDAYGETPLQLAVARGNEKVAELLRQHSGVDTTTLRTGTAIQDGAQVGGLSTDKAPLKENHPDLDFGQLVKNHSMWFIGVVGGMVVLCFAWFRSRSPSRARNLNELHLPSAQKKHKNAPDSENTKRSSVLPQPSSIQSRPPTPSQPTRSQEQLVAARGQPASFQKMLLNEIPGLAFSKDRKYATPPSEPVLEMVQEGKAESTSYICSTCNNEWPSNYCPQCGRTITQSERDKMACTLSPLTHCEQPSSTKPESPMRSPMYKIIGTDQQEYGPISEENIRQWIKEGRLNGESNIQSVGSGQWKLLRDMPEFLVKPITSDQRPGATALPSLPIAAGVSVLGLVLISFFPPVFIQYSVFVGSDLVRIANEYLIWFVPLFSRGKCITSLLIAEYICWLILAVILFTTSKCRAFHIRAGASYFLCVVLASLIIPVKRVAIFDEGFVLPPAIIREVPTGYSQQLLRKSDSPGDLPLSEAFSLIWSGSPDVSPNLVQREPGNVDYSIGGWASERPSGSQTTYERVTQTIRLGEIAPSVFFTWLMGIFLAAFIGFLYGGKAPGKPTASSEKSSQVA
jgi:serine/threonine-protein phosphatase 6 regulatory ankyrin repeat subunit B